MQAIKFALLLIISAITLTPLTANGQAFISQEAMKAFLNYEQAEIEQMPEVYYNYFVMYNSRNNNVMARNTFFKVLGDGDLEVGKQRSMLAELLNRKLLRDLSIGDTIVVPTEFDIDFRAYSPFPMNYPGGKEFDKLFIIDKTIQAFAAYEYGTLKRWGIVNTGSEESRTPNGRFNYNWKSEYRVSSLSPPGEPWEMYWVFNFHLERGIHTHQYAMPTGGPTSHGCVRMVDADAEFIYNWADGWTTSRRGTGYNTNYGKVIKPGTTVLVIGEDPAPGESPHPFRYEKRYPVLERVILPAHPYDISPGTGLQEYFDDQRGTD